ncbi:tail fiber domain-containing protein [Flavobacteriales bacterium]|nr:tail fiber domain-containing protein [Flavobacteriales bacterium]
MKKLFTLLLSISFAPFIATAQNVGVDVAAPVQKLDVDGGIRIGNTANGVAGSLRWNAPNIQYHDGTSWVTLVANSDDQALTLALNILSIENGNTVDLSAYLDDTDDQTLTLAANILSIVDGNTVDLSAYLDNTDAQTLSISGTDLTITSGNTVDLGALQGQLVDADNDTKVQVEESADEDKIRFDVAGNERWVMTGARLENASSGRSVFIGENAGQNDDLSDRDNTAVGVNALSSNITGIENTAIGKGALNSATSNRNTAVGANALGTNSTGADNTAVGNDALQSNTGGSFNTALGRSALKNNIAGSGNTAIGDDAGRNATGSDNVFIGTSAGQNETGDDQLYIDNTATTTPLIYGDFDDNILEINGTLGINGAYYFPVADGAAAGYVMSTDGAGNVSWTNPDLQGDITSIIAGDGLTTPDGSTGDVTIDINPDNSTIEVDSDILRVKPEGITTNEIATDGVDSDEIAEDAVGLSEIATGGVASDEIVDNSIDAIDINTGAVTTDEILDETILPADVNVGGTANQILAVDPTGTFVEWTDAGAVSNQLTDLDADTKIEVEASADEDFIRMTTAGGEAVTIDPVGNVGVGIVEPTRSLHVAGASGGQILVSRADATVTVGETLGEILFDAEDDNASTVDASAVIRAVSAEPSTFGNSDKGGELQFLTKSNATDENAAATERMSIAENGDVRIGESSSSGNDLYINDRIIDWDNTSFYLDPGSTSKINEIHAVGGSVTDVPYTFDGDDNTGMFRPTNHHLGLSTNGVEKVRITDVGNVGLGTTSPNEKLHLVGDQRIISNENVNTNFNSGAFRIENTAGNNTMNIDASQIQSNGDALFLQPNGLTDLRVANTDLVVDVSAARVGIGTASPAQKLHVAGNARFDDLSGTGYRSVSVDGQGDLSLNQPTTGSSGFWNRSGNTLTPTNTADNIDMNGENITDFQKLESGNLAMPNLVLNSANSGDNWTSQGAYISIGESGALGSAAMHMTYRGDGYGFIGAGTVSNAEPGYSYLRFDYNSSNIYTPDNLDVDAQIKFNSANADGPIDMDGYDIVDVDDIYVNDLYDRGSGSRIEVRDDFDLNGNDIWGVNDMTVQTIYDNGGDIVHFDQGNSNRFRVRFDVGASRDIWFDKWDGQDPMIRPGQASYGFNGKFNNYWYETYTLRLFRNQEYYFSDKRVKENIRQLDGVTSLSKVMSLAGKRYDLNKDKHPALVREDKMEEHFWKDQLGFIAQEVMEVIPEMVVLDENTGYYMIKNHEQMFPVIIEAMKEQQDQIEALKSGNSNSANDDDLKAENAELRSLIEQMQKRLEALESKK